MIKVDKVIWRETAYITLWTLIFSSLLQAVFLMIGKWNITVLLGNVYSMLLVILNFFLMGLSVQKAVAKEENDAKRFIKASSSGRMLALFIFVIIGVIIDFFNIWALIIPLFFPRVAIAFRPLFGRWFDVEMPASDADSVGTMDTEGEILNSGSAQDDEVTERKEEKDGGD